MAKDRQNLLSRIAALRGPVTYDTAQALSTYTDENDLKAALTELVNRGLLFRQKDPPHYDLHPIIRQYAYDRLSDKTSTHQTLKDYFETVPQPEKIKSLADLQPAIELFHHTISSGSYDEAARIHRDRLAKPLYYQLGAYDERITMLEAFFPDGVDQPPRLKDESAQAWILNALAIAYGTTGRCRKASDLLKRANAIDEKLDDKKNLSTILGNLVCSQILLGDLKSDEANQKRKIEIAKEIKYELSESVGHQELGRLLAYLGQYDESEKELTISLDMWENQQDEQGQCLTYSFLSLRSLLIDDPAAGQNQDLIAQAQSLAAEALDIADRCEFRLQLADIHNFLAQTAHDQAYCDGPTHAYQKALQKAQQLLDKLPPS